MYLGQVADPEAVHECLGGLPTGGRHVSLTEAHSHDLRPHAQATQRIALAIIARSNAVLHGRSLVATVRGSQRRSSETLPDELLVCKKQIGKIVAQKSAQPVRRRLGDCDTSVQRCGAPATVRARCACRARRACPAAAAARIRTSSPAGQSPALHHILSTRNLIMMRVLQHLRHCAEAPKWRRITEPKLIQMFAARHTDPGAALPGSTPSHAAQPTAKCRIRHLL